MHDHRFTMVSLYGPESEPAVPLRPHPDLAGTPVDDGERRPVGVVYGVLAESRSGLIRYYDVSLRDTSHHVLVPAGHARFEGHVEGCRLHVRSTRDELRRIPTYEPHRPPDSEYQHELISAYSRIYHGERYYAHPAYDHSGLYAGEHPLLREPPEPGFETRGLQPLAALRAFRVAAGEPDIRNWPLVTGDGKVAGRIRELLVDASARKVRYVIVGMLREEREIALPVGFLSIHRRAPEVRVPALSVGDLAQLPAYPREGLSRADERELRETLERLLRDERLFQLPDFEPRSEQRVA